MSSYKSRNAKRATIRSNRAGARERQRVSQALERGRDGKADSGTAINQPSLSPHDRQSPRPSETRLPNQADEET